MSPDGAAAHLPGHEHHTLPETFVTASAAAESTRWLIVGARRVVERVVQMPDDAAADVSRHWAALTARGIRNHWTMLLTRLRRGETEYLWPGLSSIIRCGVPLSEAPPDLTSAATEALILIDRLAQAVHDTMPNLSDPDTLELLPEVVDELGAMLREMAADGDLDDLDDESPPSSGQKVRQ